MGSQRGLGTGGPQHQFIKCLRASKQSFPGRCSNCALQESQPAVPRGRSSNTGLLGGSAERKQVARCQETNPLMLETGKCRSRRSSFCTEFGYAVASLSRTPAGGQTLLQRSEAKFISASPNGETFLCHFLFLQGHLPGLSYTLHISLS